MILVSISPYSIVKYMGLQRQLNFKNEGHIKDRHGHGNHSCQEDQSDREIQDAPASVAGYQTSGARMERRRAAGRTSLRKIMKMPTSWCLYTVMTRPIGGYNHPVDETSRKELELLQGALPSTGGNMPGAGSVMGKGDPIRKTTKRPKCTRRTSGHTCKPTLKTAARRSGVTKGKRNKLLAVDMWDRATAVIGGVGKLMRFPDC